MAEEITAVPAPERSSIAETGSITRAYASYGVTDYLRRSTRITARHATPEETEALDLAPGRVVLVLDSVNTDAQGRPIQATHSRFAADRVELSARREDRAVGPGGAASRTLRSGAQCAPETPP